MQFNSAPSVGGGSKNFLKLKDKECVKGVFRGDVYEFYCQWQEGKAHQCDQDDPKAQFRFRINFVYKENGVLVSKIWEQGATVYNMLKELNEEYDLEATIVKISRNGIGQNTTYSILPMKDPMKGELTKQVEAIELQDVYHKNVKPIKAEELIDPDEEAIPF